METLIGIDFEHTGPGTLAGRYLRRFWQPVYRAQDLAPGDAQQITICCERYTLYRGESGLAHLVAPTCAHRQTQLSIGWVEEDCLRCFYHGWKYDGTGQCVEQPAEDPAWAASIHIRSYPVQEYLGLIFAYLGEEEPPEFRRFPDFERPGIVDVCIPERWPCNYFNRIDNGCDGAHVPWTHREAIMRSGGAHRLGRLSSTIAIEETESGIRHRTVGGAGNGDWHHFHLPNISQSNGVTRIEGSIKDAMRVPCDRISWRVPVDDDNTVSFSVDLTHLTGADAEAYRERRRVSEALGEQFSPPDMGNAILAGRIKERDLDQRLSAATLFSVEDYLAQVGQGHPDRSKDRLGRIDTGTSLLRIIWRRELRALAEGRPLKAWIAPGCANQMIAETAAR